MSSPRRCSASAPINSSQATQVIRALALATGSHTYSVTQAQGVIEDFFPIGDTVANAPVQLAAQIGFASLGFAPYGGTITVSDITTGTRVVLGKGKVDSSLYGGYWTATVNVPTPGTRTLRLDYTGDSNVKGVSQTYYVPFTANDYSYVSLSSNVTNSFGGQPVTLSAAVGSNMPLHVATGTVTFYNGSIALGGVSVPKNGTAVFTTHKLPAGNNSLTASYSGDAILTPSVSAPVVETVSDYILQVIPSTVTVKQGQSGNITLNLIPEGGFANPVQLACSNLPADVTCKFSKSTITLNGTDPATAALTLKVGESAVVSQKAVTVTVTATSVAGTTPKKGSLNLTIKK